MRRSAPRDSKGHFLPSQAKLKKMLPQQLNPQPQPLNPAAEENPQPQPEESLSFSINQSSPDDNPLSGLLSRATARLESGDYEDESEAPPKKRGRPAASKFGDSQTDLANLLTSLLALVIASITIPDELKPNNEEQAGVSYYAVKILMRHFPASKMLSADMLDIIGLLSIVAGYTARIMPLLPKQAAPDPIPGPAPRPNITAPVHKNGNGKTPQAAAPIPVNDIEALDPVTAGWLKNAGG